MKTTYITPKVLIVKVSTVSVIASSMYLSEEIVSNIDELAVKRNVWDDIWGDDYDMDLEY